MSKIILALHDSYLLMFQQSHFVDDHYSRGHLNKVR